MSLSSSIQQALNAALRAQFGLDVPPADLLLQPTKKEFEGFYTFVTFPLAKQLKQAPAAIAEALGKAVLETTSLVSAYNVVQGFLNLSIADAAWLDVFRATQAPEFGQFSPKGQTVVVEYASPNTNKPLHLGHLRNNFLGYAVAEILAANGYHTVKANIINNRGIHICKSMLAYQRFGNGETPESTGEKGDHLVGRYYVKFDQAYKAEVAALVATGMSLEQAEKEASLIKAAQQMLVAWEEGDLEVRALWAEMNGWVYVGFDESWRKMGVNFDRIYYESDTYLLGKDVLDEGLEKGVFYRRPDGSVWIDLSAEGLDEKLVLRADGTSVYITQDLGLADLKYQDFPMQKSVYVVGNEQDYHFEVLFHILQKLGRPYADGLFHLSYGMVDLPSGRMKSREGTVVDADDLMAEMETTAGEMTRELGKINDFTEAEAQALYHTLAMGALKYFLLRVDPKKRMTFNPQESIEFQGNTGPFIQYTHARISAILRRAAEEGKSPRGLNPAWNTLVGLSHLHSAERELIFTLSQFPERLADAGALYSPSLLAQYAYELAKAYNQFYTELSVLNEPDPVKSGFRIELSAVVAQTIRRVLRLLGMEAPERM
ncbi:MAG: arginine--tRNA ligase [Sphingobacteriaceae bacterium]|nr:arginine--tRNA ligase [Cytophagaceae bacterium]